LTQDEHGMTARLHLAYAGLRHTFSTRNTHVVDELVTLSLIDGPFSLLEGSWRFRPIGAAGELSTTSACRIEFEMRYAFSNRALESVLSPVFDRITNTFVDSFVKRAAQVYGER
jgi:ribosome-associated toxin RatA of RatAB toxin-antitoxin module